MIEDKHMHTITLLMKSVEEKDRYTFGHSDRVAWIGSILAEFCPGISQETVYSCGLIHDVGKLRISDEILLKNGTLTKEEYQIMKTHPREGADICLMNGVSSELVDGVLYHHERWDGRGYPYGLDQNDIPLIGRIISVADSLDAMASNRPYRNALHMEKIKNEVLEGRGAQFDPYVIDIVLHQWEKLTQLLVEGIKHPMSKQV